MNPTMSAALWITLIGMGLVFIALLLLWGLMALIVNITAKQAEAESAGEAPDTDEAQPMDTPVAQSGAAAKAAALAVVVALAMQKKGQVQAAPEHPALLARQPDGEPFSAWQSVLRANRLTQKSRMYARKERGNGK